MLSVFKGLSDVTVLNLKGVVFQSAGKKVEEYTDKIQHVALKVLISFRDLTTHASHYDDLN